MPGVSVSLLSPSLGAGAGLESGLSVQCSVLPQNGGLAVLGSSGEQGAEGSRAAPPATPCAWCQPGQGKGNVQSAWEKYLTFRSRRLLTGVTLLFLSPSPGHTPPLGAFGGKSPHFCPVCLGFSLPLSLPCNVSLSVTPLPASSAPSPAIRAQHRSLLTSLPTTQAVGVGGTHGGFRWVLRGCIGLMPLLPLPHACALNLLELPSHLLVISASLAGA